MEKKVNNFYKAVAVLCFILASLCFLGAILGFIGIGPAFEELRPELFNEAITELGYSVEAANEYVNSIEAIVYVIFALCIVNGAIMIAEGVIFSKYSCMDDKTASEKYGKALAWSIVSFFFGGILIGGLALAGLLSVQKKQKEDFEKACSSPAPQTEEKKQETGISLEEIAKAEERLAKLKKLKDSQAISDEEYEKLRADIMKKVVPEKKESQPSVDEIEKARLEKLDKLLESGAITEEEYAVLKSSLKK